MTLPDRICFRRHWWRTLIPALFSCAVFIGFAYKVPDGVWVAIPTLTILVALCFLLHGGLTLSPAGVEWYLLHPSLSYRKVPWSAVRQVRRTLRVFEPIRLVVEEGKYEPWTWGTPAARRSLDLEIWSNGYVGGDKLLETVQSFWSRWR